MEHYEDHQMKIFSGRSTRYLAEKMATSLNMELGKSEVVVFSDGEFQPAYIESVRGATVFIVQSTFPPVENLFELLLMIDAARRASAYRIIAVIPYFGWARQDRKDRPRVSIGAKMVANLLHAAGCDRVMTADLHADQIQGFFDVPVDHLYASSIFLPYLRGLQLENLSIASPDMGGAKRANAYARILGAPMIICHKSREKPNVVGSMTAIGEVEGRNVVIVDDMVDTAGTITKYERINNCAIKEFIVTDTLPLRKDENTDLSKFTVLSVAPIFAEIMEKVFLNKPISDTFVY